jgi:hypothetical protein
VFRAGHVSPTPRNINGVPDMAVPGLSQCLFPRVRSFVVPGKSFGLSLAKTVRRSESEKPPRQAGPIWVQATQQHFQSRSIDSAPSTRLGHSLIFVFVELVGQ